MAITNLLSAGADAALSSPIALADGATLALVGAERPAGQASYWRVDIERQMSDGAWQTIGPLRWDTPLLTLYGEGQYRLRRQPGHGCLVDAAGGA